MNNHGKLLRIPLKRLDQFRKLRQKLLSSTNDHRLFDEEVAHLLDVDSDYDLGGNVIDDDNDDQQQSNVNDYRRITLASNDVRSRLTIIPRTEKDFGLYQCWAENLFGSNRDEPCLFNLTNNDIDINSRQQQQKTLNNHQKSQWKNTVLKHGPKLPRPVENCATTFLITSLLSIRCEHSNYSTFHQTSNDYDDDEDDEDIADRNLKFHLILKELLNNNSDPLEMNVMKTRASNNKIILLANQTNPIEPVFLISNLRATFVYEAIIYVSNDFGYSDQVTFSTLLSIAIGLCLYRRKRNKLIELHQRQLQEQQKRQQSNQSLFDQGKMNDNFSDDDDHVNKNDDDKIDVEKTRILDSGFTETFPLDDYSTGVFILDKTHSNLSNNYYQQQPTNHPLMIYRDFVSTPPSSSTSPATSMIQQQSTAATTLNLLNPLAQQSHPPITSEFLYQPAASTSGFLDRGNVQLIPSSSTSMQTTQSYLTYSNIEQQQSDTITPSLTMFTSASNTAPNNNNNNNNNQSISEL
ncbi:hypothetical protein BLA29_001663 [Euroglyphus maynei]|uniref:Ig-like domain-containing protein n=1 Tax=Euroglyphus maynei TaxID=6958 RepID=A0A1Y3BWE0_EURMA|nr:hypothetical protein BLA29_001663 [Euroglyphus maynei]